MKSLALVLLSSVWLAPNIVQADDAWRSWPNGERLKLSVGVFEADMNTEATVSQVGGIDGTPVNFEDDLGLSDSKSGLFGSIGWRMFERHSLNFNYYNLDRDAVATTSEPIIFDGIVFPSGTETDTNFDISVYELAYSYSLIFDAKKNLYFGVGLSSQDLDFRIASTQFAAVSVDESFIAPLPTVNVGFDYAISENWLLGASVGYMNADVEISGDNFDAKILMGDAGVRWKPTGNFGLGLSYALFHLDGDYTDDSINAALDLDYSGPQLSVDLFF